MMHVVPSTAFSQFFCNLPPFFIRRRLIFTVYKTSSFLSKSCHVNVLTSLVLSLAREKCSYETAIVFDSKRVVSSLP